VPRGELHVVASFPAERALGWVRPGAPARVRLDAFPWTWFGQVEASVREVGLEPKQGLLRVELTLAPSADERIPLRHGLTGQVEVEIERATPLALLVRAAGRRDDAAGAAGAGGGNAPPTRREAP
jgi:membrane fusion protein (multidrug efflux system)